MIQNSFQKHPEPIIMCEQVERYTVLPYFGVFLFADFL